MADASPTLLFRDDVSCIKESVDRLSGVKNVNDNGDRDVDADSTQGKSQDEVIRNVLEKDGELKKLRTEIVHDRKEIDETSEKFTQEMHDLQLKHSAAMHQMTTQVQEKENNANSLSEEIRNSTSFDGGKTKSTLSQYCVNIT